MYRKLRTWVVVSKRWRSVAVMNLVVNLKEQFEKYFRSPTKHFGYVQLYVTGFVAALLWSKNGGGCPPF